MKKFICLALGMVTIQAYGQDKDLEKRVEALEFSSYSSTLKWSGFFETRFDNYVKKDDGQRDVHLILSRNLAGIDFSSEPTPDLSVFGRLVYSNIFNNQGAATVNNSEGRRYNSTLASFERLFINYKVMKGLSLSVGRLPTLDGPPTNIYDGSARLGSYPRQVYSAPLDGYAATYQYQISETQNLAFRLVYSPLSQIAYSGEDTGEKNYGTKPVFGSAKGQIQNSQIPLTSWMLDYNVTGTAIARDITAIYQGFKFRDFKLGDDWKFDYQLDVIYLEFTDIAKLGLNVYTSQGQSTVTNEGGVSYTPPGSPVAIPLGSLMKQGELGATVKGKASITGLSYQVPGDMVKGLLIGYEMVQADKNALQFDFAAKDPQSFYTNRGKGTHVYLTKPLNQALKLRIGMMESKPEYEKGLGTNIVPAQNIFLFEPQKVTYTEKSMYASLRADF